MILFFAYKTDIDIMDTDVTDFDTMDLDSMDLRACVHLLVRSNASVPVSTRSFLKPISLTIEQSDCIVRLTKNNNIKGNTFFRLPDTNTFLRITNFTFACVDLRNGESSFATIILCGVFLFFFFFFVCRVIFYSLISILFYFLSMSLIFIHTMHRKPLVFF